MARSVMAVYSCELLNTAPGCVVHRASDIGVGQRLGRRLGLRRSLSLSCCRDRQVLVNLRVIDHHTALIIQGDVLQGWWVAGFFLLHDVLLLRFGVETLLPSADASCEDASRNHSRVFEILRRGIYSSNARVSIVEVSIVEVSISAPRKSR